MTAGTTAPGLSDRDAGPAPAVLAPTRLRASALGAAIGALALAAVAGVLVGPAEVDWPAVARHLASALPFVAGAGDVSQQDAAILWQLRLPRVVLGALVGGSLALAGAAYQGAFRNPLADPYLLGVAAGAGLGATLAIVAGLGGSALALPAAAFAGGFAGVGLTYAVGRTVGGTHSTAAIVLAGVAVASFLTAVQTFVLQRHADALREVYVWILGRLVTAGWQEVLLALPYVAVSAAVILAHRRLLDVLQLGSDEATSVGVPAPRVRLVLVTAATLGTAAAVAVSGLIGFVGIIIPHTIRLLVGSSARVVLPLSLVLGAAFVIAADLLARTIMAPAELPIGVVTAFFGAPFFGLVLRTSRRSLP